MKYYYNPPLIVRILNRSFHWNTRNNKILLTFDDGPTEAATLKILNILGANHLKAIFFCVGNNIKNQQALAERILSDGHTIANHTMNHKLLTKMSREESIDEITPFNNLLREIFQYNVKYFRPAHGRFNLNTNGILNELNLKCVMWNLLTYDYKNNIEKVKYAIDNYLNENSIIVFHDSIKCSDIIEDALNYTIEQAVKRGFKFGEPEDCLK
ncbi:MAG TPA: polysaccharide deacetylase family protein [Ignavibacteriaceae bacterium]|nr:polysaccharide deacetylase family protein [Ignavibacteriaceae bacterium]